MPKSKIQYINYGKDTIRGRYACISRRDHETGEERHKCYYGLSFDSMFRLYKAARKAVTRGKFVCLPAPWAGWHLERAER